MRFWSLISNLFIFTGSIGSLVGLAIMFYSLGFLFDGDSERFIAVLTAGATVGWVLGAEIRSGGKSIAEYIERRKLEEYRAVQHYLQQGQDEKWKNYISRLNGLITPEEQKASEK